MHSRITPHTTAGFTLIEMLVSLALYTIVATIAVGTLLVLIDESKRVQGDQSVMTTLTFAMDSMTREIRTGRAYYCVSSDATTGTIFGNVDQDTLDINDVLDCVKGNETNQAYHGLSFIEGGDSVTDGDLRILYYFDQSGPENRLMRRIGNDVAESIVSDGIVLSRVDFIVTGTTPLSDPSDDVEQPTVTIIIEATESGSLTDKPFVLQTTVTQRELDL
jgi:prepilin-type N-terminal cleavage/methylation domain-containing protein